MMRCPAEGFLGGARAVNTNDDAWGFRIAAHDRLTFLPESLPVHTAWAPSVTPAETAPFPPLAAVGHLISAHISIPPARGNECSDFGVELPCDLSVSGEGTNRAPVPLGSVRRITDGRCPLRLGSVHGIDGG
jgi:hypothetical protein